MPQPVKSLSVSENKCMESRFLEECCSGLKHEKLGKTDGTICRRVGACYDSVRGIVEVEIYRRQFNWITGWCNVL